MLKTDNEEFKTTYRPPYSADTSACAKMLDKYYDVKKDGEIVDVVTLTEPYNVIKSYAFDSCHVKELTLPDTVARLNHFAFADCKTLKKITLGKGIEKCGEDLTFRSNVQEIVWTKPIGVITVWVNPRRIHDILPDRRNSVKQRENISPDRRSAENIPADIQRQKHKTPKMYQ